jgi:hypothetical protein
MGDFRKQAYYLKALGVNVIPLKKDGSKLPLIYWKHLQEHLISDAEIEKYCADCGGLAAVTGKVSKLLCIDFDLDKQLLQQDYWKRFMSQVPKELKKRMLVNQTRSGGYHIWLRVDFSDQSRKITHRALTIEELYERYKEKVEEGLDPYKLSKMLLNNPRQCIIETRFEGSYAVITHPDYTRVYGEEFQSFSEEEVRLLLDIAYEMDYQFIKKVPYKGEVDDYKVIVKYNEDTKASDVMELLLSTGLYEYYNINSSKDILLKRVGSNSPYSAKIFADNAVLYNYGLNGLFTDHKNAYSPFEVYCAVNELDESEAILKLKDESKIN